MASLKGSRTEANLRAAFTSESETNRRFLYFAQQAEVDGRPEIAQLFRSVAEGETSHAFGHLEFLDELGAEGDAEADARAEAEATSGEPTEVNLRMAIAGETHDAAEMYPTYARVAREEGFAEIGEWMESLARAEEQHLRRLSDGLEAFTSSLR